MEILKSNCGRTEFLCFSDSIKQNLSSELDVTNRLVENEKEDHVIEEKNTENDYKSKHPTAIPIEGYSKSRQVVKEADIKEGSNEIIKTKENVIGKTNSQGIGGDMTEKSDGKQLQRNSKNIKQTSLSKNMGKMQNQQDYSGKSVSSKSSSFKKSHSKSHHQSSTTHHKKSIMKHHQSASSSSVVKHGVKVPFSDAVRGTKGSVR